ncbi:hypothetical protein SAMN04487917_101355 [Arthrobacter sp. yr096]|nr:hypothetical protein SAMN04487917_101355 [Arthrobacter sp. yr096]
MWVVVAFVSRASSDVLGSLPETTLPPLRFSEGDDEPRSVGATDREKASGDNFRKISELD